MKIRKLDGGLEDFNEQKLVDSIVRAGASREVAEDIFYEISQKGIPATTKQLHSDIHSRLIERYPHIAARYNIKRTLHTLGPTGYPFEKYIASIFHLMGYRTEVNKTFEGECVDHEIDVVVYNDNMTGLVECKYHLSLSAKSNIKVPLYVKSRVDDITTHQQKLNPDSRFEYYIATNTRFSIDAVDYSHCKGINLLGWNQPDEMPLPRLIDKYSLHPVTSLSTLTHKQANVLINNQIVLVRDIPSNVQALYDLGLGEDKVNSIVAEADAIIQLSL